MWSDVLCPHHPSATAQASTSLPALRIVSCLDDIVLQGSHDDVKEGTDTSDNICLRWVWLSSRARVYPAAKDALTSQLSFPAASRGMMVAACPVGVPDFVAKHVFQTAVKEDSLINTLLEFKLPTKENLLLLRKSLQVRLVHFARCVPYE